MGEEFVTISAGGRLWTAFRRVMVRASFKDAAREFHIDIAAEEGGAAAAWTFKAGTEIEIMFNGDLAFRGYVDRYRPNLDEHDKAEIAVSGRGKGQDFIDSSALHPTGRFKNKTPLEIAQTLDQFGVGIASDLALDKVPVYQLLPGETCFRAIEKLIRQQGAWMVGQGDGSIKIARAGAGRHSPLIEGVNFKGAEADHDWSGRHSKVIVRGQRPWGHGKEALEIEATAEDNAVGRNRPVVVIQDSDTDKDRAQKRADHRRDSEAGNSLKATGTMQGFHDDGGQIWTPGYLAFLDSPFLDVSQDMAIEEVTFTQSRGQGSESVLSLVDPRALGGDGRKGGKAGSAWKNGAGQ